MSATASTEMLVAAKTELATETSAAAPTVGVAEPANTLLESPKTELVPEAPAPAPASAPVPAPVPAPAAVGVEVEVAANKLLETPEQVQPCKHEAPSPPEAPPMKRLRTENDRPVDRNVAIRRQIEYYLSDQNLQHDAYFQGKMRAAEGWLGVETILSCKKMKDLAATADDIVAALKESQLIVEVPEGKATSARVRRSGPLPELQPRAPGAATKPTVKGLELGPILECNNIPDDLSWEALRKKLQDTAEEVHKKTPGGLLSNPRVDFASNVIEGRAYILLRPMNGVEKWFESHLTTFDVNGTELSLKLVTDAEAAVTIVQKHVPVAVRIAREKMKQKQKSGRDQKKKGGNNNNNNNNNDKKLITIGQMEFKGITHFRVCLKEVLDKQKNSSEDKQPVNERVSAVLEELLKKYHPRGEDKLKDKVGFATGNVEKDGVKFGRCFFVKKSDGTYEDFSVLKCISQLQDSSSNSP